MFSSPVIESCDVDHSDDLLVDIGAVGLCVGHFDQPFLSVLADDAEVILEGAEGTHVQGFLKWWKNGINV